jgi:hypothetical protein
MGASTSRSKKPGPKQKDPAYLREIQHLPLHYNAHDITVKWYFIADLTVSSHLPGQFAAEGNCTKKNRVQRAGKTTRIAAAEGFQCE